MLDRTKSASGQGDHLQTNSLAPAPSTQPVKKGTPFLHCAAGASFWYIALVAVVAAIAMTPRAGLGDVLLALTIGAVLWILTTTATWLILLRTRVRTWVLIPLTAPVYVLVGMVIGALAVPFMNVYLALVS
jgi:hypothetical protein